MNLGYEIPSFISSDNEMVTKLNYLKPCIEILQQGFVAEQYGQMDITIKIGKLAYTKCPQVGMVRYFAAHTIVQGIDSIIEQDSRKAYQLLLTAKELDPYNPDINNKINFLLGK